MGKHRKEDGNTPNAALQQSLTRTLRPTQHQTKSGKQTNHEHRTTSAVPTGPRVIAALLAAGAVATVSQPVATGANKEPVEHQVRPVAHQQNLGSALTGSQQVDPSVRLLAAQADPETRSEAVKVQKSMKLAQQRAQQEAERKARVEAERQAREARERAERQAAEQRAAEQRAAEEAAATQAGNVTSSGYAKPTDGTFTSGFGARWGTSHNGIDLANSIGTPIHSVSGGEVIDAGPASGFGQWIRVQHDDGTITVYGHINTIDVSVGQRVEAGEQIATMGNEGQSTGPHLHFEVIQNGSKINPLPWLEERGLSVS